MRRARLALVAGVGALLVGLLPWSPPAVRAALTPPATPEQVSGDVNLLFSRGGSPARYPANSVIRVDAGNINFVKGCIPGPDGRGFPDFVQASADLYIVASGRTFTNGTALVDALGAPNTVWAGLGGSFLYEPLALAGSAGSATGLPSGTYDVVVDECQNGIWDTGQDTVVRDAFRVDIDQEVPGLDLEAAEFLALKARAGERLNGTSQVESVLDQLLLLELYNQVKSIVNATTGVAGFATFAAKLLVPSLDPIGALQNWGRGIILNSVQKRRAALINMRDDPPDPNFQMFASVARTTDTASAPVPDLDSTFAVLSTFDAMVAAEAAFVRALERYQGAQVQGNVAWAARHARSMDELATLHAELSQLQLALVAPVVASYGPSAPIEVRLRQFGLRDDLNRTFAQFARGYETNALWWNTGLDPAETEAAIEVYRDSVVNAPPLGTDTLLLGVSDAEEGLIANANADVQFSQELRAWVDSALPGVLGELDALTNPIAADPLVTIVPVAGAAAGSTTQLEVTLPADYVADTVRWDLDGDGEFDDATGVTPSWSVPGDLRAGVPFVIAVEVTGGLTADVAYEVVIPVAGNQPPVISQVRPDPADGTPGATTTFEVSTSDPDGGAVTVEWFVDGAPAGTGTTFDLAVPADFYGQIEVVAVATDDSGATATTAFPLSVRSGVDDDNDGYFAAPGPDCDDSERFVNPGRAEVVGDGIDNDCDPSTSDAGTPIGPGVLSPAFFNAIEGDVYEVQLTNWTHPNRRADVPFTLEIDWGDGTSSTQTVQGTDTASTNFALSHRYVDELVEGDVRWCVANDADPPGCGSRIGWFEIDNDAPFVGAADLREWSQEDSSQNPAQCLFAPRCGTTGAWSVDGDGRTATSTGNPSETHVLFSPVALAEDGYGRAMVELSVPFPSGDDDTMGLVVGYEAGDVLGLTGAEDFVDFEWNGRGRGLQTGESATNPPECNGVVPAPGDEFTDPATISRTRGPASRTERSFNLVLEAVEDGDGPVNPLCIDAFGVDELLAIEFQASDLPVNPALGGWLSRTIRANDLRGPPSGPIATPYTFTVDYRPDRLRMWTANGSLVADVAPRSADDPFPPGGLGVVYWSQPLVRAKATAPEPAFTFTQGTPGAITMPFVDGGDDEWVATIDWGDGSSQTAGTITADTATGAGWYDVSGSHSYLRAGTLRGEVCVVDDLDEGSCFTFRVTVDNLPPVVEAGPDLAGEADLVSGAAFELTQATFTDPGTNDDHTATIDWGDGSPVVAGTVASTRSTGGSVTGSHTYAADGRYEVEVCVSDQAGGVGCDTLEVDVRVANQPPVAAVEAPPEEFINVEVPLGGGFTDPNPDDTHTMTIDPGDGTGEQTLSLRSGRGVGSGGIGHVYAAPGTYSVTACVTDAAGENDCAVTEIVALDDGTANQPPVIDTGGPYVVDEGTTVTLDASGSSDPEGGEVTVAWDVDGDGVFETPGATLEVDADDGPGSIPVDLQVCDPEALCVTGTALVQVEGVAPTITGLSVDILGSSATAAVSFTDPSPTDTHTVVVDWGDGTPTSSADSAASGGGTVALEHTYAPGVWTVVATVTDDDGDQTRESTQVVVLAPNRAPVADAGGPYTVSEGSTATLDGSGSFDPDGDDVTLGWDTDGDGEFDDPASFVAVDGPATRTVSVQACDPSGECAIDTAVVTVANQAPILDEPTVTVDAAEATVVVTFADPGVDDTHTIVVDWGDGAPPTELASSTAGGATVSSAHTYEPGTWDGRVTVTDDDGGSTSRSFRVDTSPSSTSSSSTSSSSTSTSTSSTTSAPTVSTSTTIATSSLPGTGQNSTGRLVTIAMVVLALGAMVALFARRRRTS